METTLYILIGIFFVFIAWWWFIARNQPKYPPLEIADDDPAILQAMKDAKASVPSFLELLSQAHSEAQVKVPFISNSGETEHLWAEVLEPGRETIKVRYLTPPVTHSGKLERVHDIPVFEITDWVVIDEHDRIHGGYTQRVMFKRAREEWGQLPPELAEQESRYVT